MLQFFNFKFSCSRTLKRKKKLIFISSIYPNVIILICNQFFKSEYFNFKKNTKSSKSNESFFIHSHQGSSFLYSEYINLDAKFSSEKDWKKTLIIKSVQTSLPFFALLKFTIWYWNTFLNKCGYVIHYFNAYFSFCFCDRLFTCHLF